MSSPEHVNRGKLEIVQPQFDDDGYGDLFGCEEDGSFGGDPRAAEDASPLYQPEEQNDAPETAPASAPELPMPQPAYELLMPEPVAPERRVPEQVLELPMSEPSAPKPQMSQQAPELSMTSHWTPPSHPPDSRPEPPMTPQGRRFPGNHNVDFAGRNQQQYLQEGLAANISPKTRNVMGPPSPRPAHGFTRQSLGRMPSAGRSRPPSANALNPQRLSTRSMTRALEEGFDPNQPPMRPKSLDPNEALKQGKYKIIRLLAPPPSPPLPPIAGGKDAKKISNNRKLKDDPENQPERFYKAPTPTEPWGPVPTEGAKPIFEYFKKSPELWPHKTYTRDQLLLFFLGTWRKPKREGKLTIWIQNTPAQSNERYTAGANSGKCRWVGCPAKTNTILKGFLRVAFDEHPKLTTRGITNPFQMAGYMHLYCFEEIFDLGFLVHWADLIWGFQVRPDVRVLPKESSNRMSLVRDHSELLEVYLEWKMDQGRRVLPKAKTVEAGQPKRHGLEALQPSRPRREADYLWRRLTEAHLQLEVRGRAATRDRRGGANIGEHKGDLRKFLALKGEMKRQLEDSGGEEDDDDGSVIEVPAPKKQKVATRPDQLHVTSLTNEMIHPVLNPPQLVNTTETMLELFGGTEPSNFQAMPNYNPQGGFISTDPSYPQADVNPQANYPQADFNPQASYPQADVNSQANNQTFYPPQQASPVQSLEQLHAIHTQEQNRPLTRAMSRASAEAVQNTLASPGLLNGPVMDEVFDVIAPQPQHIRDQIFSEAPAHVAEELQTRLASLPGESASAPAPAPAPERDPASDGAIYEDYQ
ncbi:hypothetical protein B0T14DRAFT_553144 [Immersiella caudata]|uniref:Uncharacterized protein n=1 Tax=Immersiella caudata TaxID=314043 RepID=A0AA39WX22_9PEZI|nr:hypothetical protein B0T14DRAFT_553144 [Immersiella caudata]